MPITAYLIVVLWLETTRAQIKEADVVITFLSGWWTREGRARLDQRNHPFTVIAIHSNVRQVRALGHA